MDILIADDDTTSRLVLGLALQKLGHHVTAVVDGDAALLAWRRQLFSLLISDWMMPGLDGPALCRAIRTAECQHYTYLLLLTAHGGRTNYLEGIQAGADDFLTKPFDEELLAARLHVAERILQLHETLRREATHDRLTGVLNRAAILDHLQQALERRVREGGDIGLILVDLDHFKQINDRHGHLAGDAVLQEAARRMRMALRPYDRVGRYGGEEFLVLAPDSGSDDTRAIAERIRQAIQATPIVAGDGELIVTASLGLANARGGSFDPADLIAPADAALYRAKKGGRNRVEAELE